MVYLYLQEYLHVFCIPNNFQISISLINTVVEQIGDDIEKIFNMLHHVEENNKNKNDALHNTFYFTQTKILM